MAVNIVAKGFELVAGTHEAINDEINQLNKTLAINPNYRVTLKKRVYGEYECSITTSINSKPMTVRATRNSIRFAIEAAVKALKEMAIENKDKVITKKMNGTYEKEDAPVAEKEAEEITKHKDVHLTPISDEEAIDELNKTDFDMYVYLDEATLETKAVYHRAEGYGVITFKTV